MNAALAHCPYCLSNNLILTDHTLGFQITCQTCSASGPCKETKKEARSVWDQLTTELDKSRESHASHFVDRLKELERVMTPARELLKEANSR
jgi:hypothetical protein